MNSHSYAYELHNLMVSCMNALTIVVLTVYVRRHPQILTPSPSSFLACRCGGTVGPPPITETSAIIMILALVIVQCTDIVES